MRKIDSRTANAEVLDMMDIPSDRFYFHSDYSCNVECGGNHPHISVTEYRTGDRKEELVETKDGDCDFVLRPVKESHFVVAGQSLRAGIHTSGMEFRFDVSTLEEAEKAIEDFEFRKL